MWHFCDTVNISIWTALTFNVTEFSNIKIRIMNFSPPMVTSMIFIVSLSSDIHHVRVPAIFTFRLAILFFFNSNFLNPSNSMGLGFFIRQFPQCFLHCISFLKLFFLFQGRWFLLRNRPVNRRVRFTHQKTFHFTRQDVLSFMHSIIRMPVMVHEMHPTWLKQYLGYFCWICIII